MISLDCLVFSSLLIIEFNLYDNWWYCALSIGWRLIGVNITLNLAMFASLSEMVIMIRPQKRSTCLLGVADNPRMWCRV